MKYVNPELEIIKFSVEDIVTVSVDESGNVDKIEGM